MPRPTLSQRARAMFGLLDRNDSHADLARRDALALAARRLDRQLAPGKLALIVGPSGAGKSSLAHALRQLLTPRSEPEAEARAFGHSQPDAEARAALVSSGVAGFQPATHSPLDLLTGPLARRLRLLSDVGLSDAHLFVRPAHLLSTGQQSRLAIARAIDALDLSSPRPTLILDEFASTLDRPAATRLAHLLRRWLARHPRVRVVAITAHDDLADDLAPDLLVRAAPATPEAPAFLFSAPSTAAPHAATPSSPVPTIEPGTRDDYRALAPYHYRAGPPAVIAGPRAILRATDPATGDLIGVLVVAMPTLNAPWRDALWPGRYRTRDKRADARRLGDELRCIARVIVHPDHRARGVAVALVRHYLEEPLTPATEALAAMGVASPFFQRAGMRAFRLPPTRRDARLRDALTFARRTPVDLLALAASDAREPARDAAPDPLLRRELRRWGNSSRATRALADDLPALARRAAGALLAPPVVYAHVAPGSAMPLNHEAPEDADAARDIRRAA